VYLRVYQDGKEAKMFLSNYYRFYNSERLYQAHHYRTPAEVFTCALTSVATFAGKMVESLSSNTLRTAEPNLNITPILS